MDTRLYAGTDRAVTAKVAVQRSAALNLLCQRIARQQRLRHRQSASARQRNRRRAAEEFAPVDASMTIRIVQVEHALIDFRFTNASSSRDR